MQTFDELEAAWRAAGGGPTGIGTVRLICVRRGGGVHACPPAVQVTTERGVEGDRWFEKARRNPSAQVTLMSARVAAVVAAGRVPLHMAGDNFLVDLDLGEAALPFGVRVRIGGAVLEVTPHPHTGCKKFRDRFGAEALRWVNHEAHRGRRLRGVNCRVLSGGRVAVGDAVEIGPMADVFR